MMPPISAPARPIISACQVAHIDLAESNARWYNVLRADQSEPRAGQEHRGSAGAATTPAVSVVWHTSPPAASPGEAGVLRLPRNRCVLKSIRSPRVDYSMPRLSIPLKGILASPEDPVDQIACPLEMPIH